MKVFNILTVFIIISTSKSVLLSSKFQVTIEAYPECKCGGLEDVYMVVSNKKTEKRYVRKTKRCENKYQLTDLFEQYDGEQNDVYVGFLHYNCDKFVYTRLNLTMDCYSITRNNGNHVMYSCYEGEPTY
uniref:NTR domain-containing protein n=1 Tax=Strongyloides papillosus TaxID=174720 RepID=A0A0N5CFB0_STREA